MWWAFGGASSAVRLRLQPVSGVLAARTNPCQQFENLHRVERRALAQLISAGKEIHAPAVGLAGVFAEASDEDVVAAGGVDGHGEGVAFAVVDEAHARGAGQGLAGLGDGDGAFERQVDRLRMRPRDGDADADPALRCIPDIPSQTVDALG